MQAIPDDFTRSRKLREELDFLKSVRRLQIIAAIAEAREYGDLKEKRGVSAPHANSRVSVKGALKISKQTVECAGD